MEEMHYTRFERIDDAQCFKDFKETSRDGCAGCGTPGELYTLSRRAVYFRDLLQHRLLHIEYPFRRIHCS